MTRAASAVETIDEALAKAQRLGHLRFLNSEYRRRRTEATERGETYMPYRAAQARLARAVADVPAGKLTTSIFSRVFEGE